MMGMKAKQKYLVCIIDEQTGQRDPLPYNFVPIPLSVVVDPALSEVVPSAQVLQNPGK